MSRFIAIFVACFVSAAFILSCALLGTGMLLVMPLMLFVGIGWMHIALDVRDHLAGDAQPGRSLGALLRAIPARRPAMPTAPPARLHEVPGV